MTDFTIALERELHRLEGEIEQDPRLRRIKQIRQLLADYQAGTTNGPQVSPRPTTPPPAPTGAPSRPHVAAAPTPRRRRRAHLSKATTVRMAVQQLLAENGIMHRSDILKHLVEQRLMGHEKRPIASLAAYLSSWKTLFAPDGHGNFKLKKPAEGGAGAASVSH